MDVVSYGNSKKELICGMCYGTSNYLVKEVYCAYINDYFVGVHVDCPLCGAINRIGDFSTSAILEQKDIDKLGKKWVIINIENYSNHLGEKPIISDKHARF